MISQNTVGISELNVTDGSNGQVLTTNGSGTFLLPINQQEQ